MTQIIYQETREPCLWMKTLQGVWIFFRIQNTRLLKVESDISPDDRKCDDCIDKAAGVAVTEVDTS